MRSQTVISNAAGVGAGRDGRRSAPYAFTEQGVAMLSSILSSEQAVAVNVQIMRTFVRVRELALEHKDLAQLLAELHERMERLELGHDTFSRNTRAQLKQVFDALRELMTPSEPPKRPIGFITPEDKDKKDSPKGSTKSVFTISFLGQSWGEEKAVPKRHQSREVCPDRAAAAQRPA